MANNGLKTSLKTDLIEIIRSGMLNLENYYLFVSRAQPYEDNPLTTSVVESDAIPPSIGESSRNVYDTLRNTLFIKRIQPDNVKIVIPRVNWTSGTAYTAYSEQTDMAGKTYYVMTSEYNVYKCLGANGLSRVMPTGKSTDPITLSDGYQWKYIYSVPEDYLGFITLEYIPVYIASSADKDRQDQKLVQQRAMPGSIDSLSINASLSPTFSKIYRTERIIPSGSSVFSVLGVTANVRGSTYIAINPQGEATAPASDYWNDYAIHITKGAGVGQYFRITDFVKEADLAGNSFYYATVYPEITRDLAPSQSENESHYKIVPYVVVDGDGDNAVVVPTTASDKKIKGLSIVSKGTNYTYAKPRVVTEANSVEIGDEIADLNNSISADLSTPLGHGANAIKEFGSSDLMIIVEVDGEESGKISTRNDYRQFGIIKNPKLYGGLTLAGAEEDIAYRLLIKKQPTKDQLYTTNTFINDNYIFGKESRATARIRGFERISGSEYDYLEISNVEGNFRFSDEASLKSRVYFTNAFAGTLVTGDDVFQYQGITGLTLSASGTLISYDMGERNFVVETASGAFAEGKSIFFTSGDTMGSTYIIDIDEDFGELFGQLALGSTSGSDFLLFGGDENFGRIAGLGYERKNVEDVGEYTLTTKIVLRSSGSDYTDGQILGSNAYDGTITQVNGTTLKKVTGTIVDFVVDGGSGLTGILHLSNLTGTFNTTNSLTFTEAGSTAENAITSTAISSITNPEIEIGSGEVLYIENIRPVERNYEQAEEFKIVIGF